MRLARKCISDAYARAERFLFWNSDKFCLNLEIDYHWIGATDSFWYLRRTAQGKEFVIVDAAVGSRRAAFDHALLAKQLSGKFGLPIDPLKLPFDDIALSETGQTVTFSTGGRQITCEADSGNILRDEQMASGECGLPSPDSCWALFTQDSNLWLRSLTDGSLRRLTEDGREDHAYAKVPGSGAGFRSFLPQTTGPQTAIALWSPDSTRFVTYRLDERHVKKLHLLEATPAHGFRPILYSYPYAFPGDAHKPSAELLIFDVATGTARQIPHLSVPVTMLDPVQDDRVWWDDDCRRVYVIPREEGQRRAQLLEMNIDSGAVRVLLEESGKTYVEIAGSAWSRAVSVLRDGRIIWYSERDDWGHLYLYDHDGILIRQLTSGAWKVIDVVRIDESAGTVYFTAVGRERGEDPYQRHLYAVDIEDTEVRLLTPEDADHEIRIASSTIIQKLVPGAVGPKRSSVSPSGKYFVGAYSRPDMPPTAVVRSAGGQLISILEKSDISALERGGFAPPEPFHAFGADGETLLYGTLYRPSTFDPAEKYPVIDVVYPGPQMIVTPKGFKQALYGLYAPMCTQALAELGFIVITVDGRGTPLRSKSFHDVSYGHMEQAGQLEDHVAALRQLGTRYPFMDLDRVGITGHSGGGFATTRALLTHPEFYKVGVSLAGNHNVRAYLLVWGPTYQGTSEEERLDAASNASLAPRLKGKLLLMHGELDDNVHPAHAMRLVQALIKAGKEFECLILPGEDHMLTRGTLPYIHRRTWDYFVRHLLGTDPPAEYLLAGSDCSQRDSLDGR